MKALIVSANLDTNGQNARFVRAAERWGDDPDVLKALAVGKYDPASVVGRFQAATHPGLVIRSAHRQTHIYQQMPPDIVWDRRTDRQVRQLAREADLIHLNNSWRAWQLLNIHRKPIVVHHHGSMFRWTPGPDPLLQKARQMKVLQMVSTVDLLRHGEEYFDPAEKRWHPRRPGLRKWEPPATLHYQPTAYDIDWLQDFGKRHRDDHEGIRVISAPTNREYKSTSALEVAVRALQNDGLDVELVLVEGKPWRDGMAIKATADIYFDQVQLGYGCNAVEAWGMGIPVIAGADEWTLTKMRNIYGKTLPFYEATEATIKDAIADLATNKAKRTQYAKRGLSHVRRWHDEKPALTRLATLYRLALEEQEAHIEMPAPTMKFTANRRQLHVANRYINFPFETDNEYLARRIREYGVRFPQHGITEEIA